MESTIPPQIILPRIVTRKFIQQHPDWVFLYGADYFRKGALGQMWECHGEPNTFPLTTCYKLCASGDRYWSDTWELGWESLQNDLHHIVYRAINKEGPVIPLRKIGQGASRMCDMAPKLYRFMQDFIDRNKYKNIRIDYAAN